MNTQIIQRQLAQLNEEQLQEFQELSYQRLSLGRVCAFLPIKMLSSKEDYVVYWLDIVNWVKLASIYNLDVSVHILRKQVGELYISNILLDLAVSTNWQKLAK